MKQGSDQALKLATLDAEAKEANQAGYIAGVEGIGDKEEAIQQREIGAAQSAKAALLGASDQNFSGALTAAAGGAEVAGTYLTSDEAKEKRAKKKAEKEGTK